MGRQNSADKNVSKKVTRKTRLLHSKESAITSKKISSNKKNENGESDDVDSLMFLKDVGESKKLKGLDERIKLLKTELKFLIGDRNPEKDPDSNLGYDLVSITSSNLDVKKVESTIELEGNQGVEESQIHEAKHFSPNYNSTPAKFSEWLDKTTDEMNSKSQDTIFLGNESQLNSKLNSTVKAPPLKSFPVYSKTSTSKESLVPTERVEELLFKAFLLQNNSSVNFSHSQVGDSEEVVSIAEEKQEKSKKFKAPKRKPIKGKPKEGSSGVKTCHRYPRRKRRRLISTSESDIEIIDLESTSGSNNISNTSIVCVDLDVSNYDWSEPFEINEETEFHSDMQIIHDTEKNNENIIQPKCTAPQELEKSISLNDTGNLTQKKIWECPVCFEQSKGQEIVATQCGHIFCRKCLENHIAKLTSNCPSCRCNLKNKPFITLFNF